MKSRPLVYQITNTVSAQLQADCTALLGGLSIMSRSADEAAEIAGASDALLINIGTPPDDAARLYDLAAKAAEKAGIPSVLDIVGFGFTRLRTELVLGLLADHRFSAVKGNFSEIAALCGKDAAPRGVSEDSAHSYPDMKDIVMECSARYGCAVFATGIDDHLALGTRYSKVSGGSALMQGLSGFGCALGSAAALFAAQMPVFEASLLALRLFRRAAEEAEASAAGPFSFRGVFLDRLGTLAHELKEHDINDGQ